MEALIESIVTPLVDFPDDIKIEKRDEEKKSFII